MNAIKEKLKKDLRWIKYTFVKIILTVAFTFLLAIVLDVRPENEVQLLVFGLIFFFTVLYLFSAWLYAEEEIKAQPESGDAKDES